VLTPSYGQRSSESGEAILKCPPGEEDVMAAVGAAILNQRGVHMPGFDGTGPMVPVP